MSLTIEDYGRAVDGVARDVQALGDGLVSAYLYGSTARGEPRLGESDADVTVFVRREVLDNRESFFSMLGVLEQVARGVAVRVQVCPRHPAPCGERSCAAAR